MVRRIMLWKKIDHPSGVTYGKIQPEPKHIRSYSQIRKQYKNLLKNKRKDYMEQEAINMVEEARKDPYLALRPRKVQSSGKIDITVWEEHFSSILNIERTNAAYERITMDTHLAERTPSRRLRYTRY